MNKYKVLLFDLDDTILSFEKGEDYAIAKLLEYFGIDAKEENKKLYSDINKSYWKKLEKDEVERDYILKARFNDLFNILKPTKNEESLDNANDLYFDFLTSVVYILDGAVESIQKLKEKYQIYLITNGVKRVQDKRLALAPSVKALFDKIFISEEVGFTKPQKGFMDKILSDCSFKKEEMLIIGDSLSSDMLLGINNGVDTCWFNPKGKNSDMNLTYIVSGYEEILKILN